MARSRRLKEDSHFVIYSDAFLDVLEPDPGYETVSNVNAHEGPVYVRDWDAVLFTTVPVTTNIPAFGDKNVAIGRLDVASGKVSTFVAETNMANGMTLDRQGRLLICEQGSLETAARISRMNLKTKKIETVVDHWFGLPFNSPNDIVEKSDGTIWFTDPAYGALPRSRHDCAPQESLRPPADDVPDPCHADRCPARASDSRARQNGLSKT
jgi:gluconolactonase